MLKGGRQSPLEGRRKEWSIAELSPQGGSGVGGISSAVWQGRLDSNQRMRESKSLALPLGYVPMCGKSAGTGEMPRSPACVGWEMGLEPTTPGTTIRCSNQLSYTHHI